MSFLGFPASQAERKRINENWEMRMLAPKPKKYKWGYCFVPASGEYELRDIYYDKIDTADFINFKKVISDQLGNEYESFKDYWYKDRSYERHETIRILTNNGELDALYIKMVSNFDMLKKINFADELAACVERQRVIHIYDEEHIDQTIRTMKRLSVKRRPFGAKTPLLNKLDILKTDRNIIPFIKKLISL